MPIFVNSRKSQVIRGTQENDVFYAFGTNAGSFLADAIMSVFSWETSVSKPDGTRFVYTASNVSISTDLIRGSSGSDSVIGSAYDDVLVQNNGVQWNGLGGLRSIEYLWLGDGNDFLDLSPRGDEGSPYLIGVSVYGQKGNDVIIGGAGDDMLDGGKAADLLIGGSGTDQLFGGSGDDHLYADSMDPNDIINPPDGDVAEGGFATWEHLDGGEGNDLLVGGAGSDRLWGHVGDDVLQGWDGTDYLNGGPGNDTMYGGAGLDYFYGSWGDDLLFGGDGDDEMWGDEGNDIIDGGDGNDWLVGENDDYEDLWYADPAVGDDILRGGAGDDALVGYGGSDSLLGGEGADYLYGGADRLTDVYVYDQTALTGTDTIVFENWYDKIAFQGLGVTAYAPGGGNGTVFASDMAGVPGESQDHVRLDIVTGAGDQFSIELFGTVDWWYGPFDASSIDANDFIFG